MRASRTGLSVAAIACASVVTAGLDFPVDSADSWCLDTLRTSFARFAYRVSGDTLWLTRRGAGGVFRMKLVRAE